MNRTIAAPAASSPADSSSQRKNRDEVDRLANPSIQCRSSHSDHVQRHRERWDRESASPGVEPGRGAAPGRPAPGRPARCAGRGASPAASGVILAVAMIGAGSLASIAGCERNAGTISLSLSSEPGSDLIDRVARVRLTLSDPDEVEVVEAERDRDGRLSLAFDLEVGNAIGTLTFEGFDRAGDLIAFGRSGPLPLSGLTAEISIHVAPPQSVTRAPVTLDPPRSAMGSAALSFGVALVGGRDGAGDVVATVDVYSVYSGDLRSEDQGLQSRILDLPGPRTVPTVALGSFGDVFIFGGAGPDGQDAHDAWRMRSSLGPRGGYINMASDPALARSGAAAAVQGPDVFVVAGSPPVRIDGSTNTITAVTATAGDPPALGGTATTVIDQGGFVTLFAGAGNGEGGVIFAAGGFTDVPDSGELARVGHGTVGLPDNTALTIGGEIAGALATTAARFDPGDRSITVLQDFLATPRQGAAVLTTDQYLLVIGGTDRDGAAIGDLEIFDLESLDPLGTRAIIPRTGASAEPMVNGQALIVGGVDVEGAPVLDIELFTPGPR